MNGGERRRSVRLFATSRRNSQGRIPPFHSNHGQLAGVLRSNRFDCSYGFGLFVRLVAQFIRSLLRDFVDRAISFALYYPPFLDSVSHGRKLGLAIAEKAWL